MRREEAEAIFNRPATYVRPAKINNSPGYVLFDGNGVIICHAFDRFSLDAMIAESGLIHPETIH